VQNDFPALPVREDEHVLVHVARYPSDQPSPSPELCAEHLGPPIELRLPPTARSLLR
jgi:hypothetical protein